MDLVNYVKKNPGLIKYQKLIKRNEGWTSVLAKDEKFSNDDLLTSSNDFDKVVKIITERNNEKPFPDINDFPN